MNRCTLIKDIIQGNQLYVLFQPIYKTDLGNGHLCGFEALIRGPSNSPLHSPKALFETAIECDCLSELELACRRISIARFVGLNLPGLLFLNVNPMTFMADDHPTGETLSYLERLGLDPGRVVIELSEQYPVDNPELLRKALLHYKNLGLKVAIDDLGAGYAGLRFWSEIRPDYVKIDRYFINQIHQDPVKKEFVRNIVNLASGIATEVVAEGIELEEELNELRHLGIHYAQGFLLGRPESNPSTTLPKVLEDSPRRRQHLHMDKQVGLLLQDSLYTDQDTHAGKVITLFHAHDQLLCVPILNNHTAIGVVWRDELLEHFSTPFGRALYEHKPISRLMSQDIVMVDTVTPLNQVASQITQRYPDKLPSNFIMTSNDHFVGIGSVRDLLQEITKQQIQYASYANPLSLLPGNVPIYQHIDHLISLEQPFHLAYFDLNHFKPFNDVYGYSQGDRVIKMVAELLTRHCQPEDFIGHIGGDDFVVIFHDHHWHQICTTILEEFDREVRHLYTPDDLKAGGIQAESRTGEPMFFPLLGLAIGVVQPDTILCHCHSQVAALATSAKKEAKRTGCSTLFLSRRRH